MVDLIRQLRLPALLVSRTSLGTINHTLLSLAALRVAKVRVHGVVLVGPRNRENRKAIEHYGEAEVIGWVPKLPKLDRATLLRVFQKEFDPRAFSA